MSFPFVEYSNCPRASVPTKTNPPIIEQSKTLRIKWKNLGCTGQTACTGTGVALRLALDSNRARKEWQCPASPLHVQDRRRRHHHPNTAAIPSATYPKFSVEWLAFSRAALSVRQSLNVLGALGEGALHRRQRLRAAQKQRRQRGRSKKKRNDSCQCNYVSASSSERRPLNEEGVFRGQEPVARFAAFVSLTPKTEH